MSADANVETIRALFAIVEARELDQIANYVAPSLRRHDLVGAYPGVTGENVTDFLNELLGAVPDLALNIQDVFGADDRVAVRFTFEGTHVGEFFGQPGTGKRFSMNAINIYRLEGGKVAETWQLEDLAGFLDQIDG